MKEGQRERLGAFECEFLAVNHSIPDALAVAIRTPAGLVLHTGDFKMDQLPLDGRLTDLGGFARLGAEGIDLLMSDSTNAEVPGFVTSEREITPVLRRVFETAKRRVIVACFASHVHRVQQVLDVAVQEPPQGRLRRSLDGAQHGRRARPRLLARAGRFASSMLAKSMPCPPEQVVLISTGSQGEPLSALSRMAGGDHPVRIEPGDTVVLASSLIPGNETSVFRVVNGLSRWGATVVHKSNALVHVSGHAAAGELLYVLNLTRPSNFMPIHGEWRHLQAHAAIARLSGVDTDRIVIADDGHVVDLVDGRAIDASALSVAATSTSTVYPSAR